MALRALITGVNGFVGPHLVRFLAEATDWILYGVGRESAVSDHAQLRVCDLLDREQLRRVLTDVAPDFVFHLASQSHVPTSHADPAGTLMNNVVGQVNLLDACRALPHPPRILIVGSAEEYGLARPEEMPLTEEQPFRPTSPYAVSKVTQDLLGWQYFLSYGLPIVRVRPFNHIGPGQHDLFVIPSFARQIAEAEAGLREPTVRVGNLSAGRDFLDVRDVVRAYHLAITLGTPGDVYNVGSGTAVTIADALALLRSLARVVVDVEVDPSRLRPSDVPLLVASSTRLQEATGWRQTISFEQSIRDTLDWWRAEVRAAQRDPALSAGQQQS